MAGKKILVADDSLTIQKVIKLALSGDGYEILTVSDGQECVEQASLFRPDICIVDVSLPKRDAYQVKEYFASKTDLKNIPVILMSSAFEKVDEVRAQSLEFSGHLIKPFDPAHLRTTLSSVAQNAPKIDPIIEAISNPLHEMESDFPPLMDQDIHSLTKTTFEMSAQHHAHETPMDWTISEVRPIELASMSANSEGKSTVSMTQDQLDQVIHAEVKLALDKFKEEMAEKFDTLLNHYVDHQMPEMAEKIIKSEIQRLLAEPPTL